MSRPHTEGDVVIRSQLAVSLHKRTQGFFPLKKKLANTSKNSKRKGFCYCTHPPVEL